MERQREDVWMDKAFLRENMMGPNCIRILEELVARIPLKREMRLLDLGCGKGLTSLFLAERFGATVFATDLWISATENFHRFTQRGMADKIIPIHADAQMLPYGEGFFDAVISVGAYNFFGAKTGFLDKQIAPLVKPGGMIAISVPGLKQEFTDGVPEALRPFWQKDINFYSAKWWRKLWNESKQVVVEQVWSLACHQEAWNDWLQCDNPYAQRDITMMEAEKGMYFDTIGLIARVG